MCVYLRNYMQFGISGVRRGFFCERICTDVTFALHSHRVLPFILFSKEKRDAFTFNKKALF